MSKNITARNSQSVESIINDLKKHPLLTLEQELELSNRIKEGDEDAVRELYNGNLRFVVSAAKQYLDKGLSLEELIQAGNKGLEIAARKYDASQGFKFISYAIWWIRQSILLELKESGEEGKKFFLKHEEREKKIQEFGGMLSSGNVKQEILDAVEELPTREKEILKYSYGIGCEAISDEDLCKRFGITQLRLEQIRTLTMVGLRRKFIK